MFIAFFSSLNGKDRSSYYLMMLQCSCFFILAILLQKECDACRRVISPHLPITEQLCKANAHYIINSEIDLNGLDISIPENSTLSFYDGCFKNGGIIGNNTLLTGKVKVDRISGSFRNKEFYSSWSTRRTDYFKARSLSSLCVESLIIDEDYYIDSFEGAIRTSIKSIKGKNSVIQIACDLLKTKTTPDFFIILTEPASELSGFSVRMNSFAAKGFARILSTDSRCNVHDISIDGINQQRLSLSIDSYIHGMEMTVSDHSKLSIDNVSISNFASSANGIIGDSSGSISGLQIYVKGGLESSIDISNCCFIEMHNYRNGKIILEDVSGIFIQEGYPVSSRSSVYIRNISGINYGKRLIKTNCSNLRIANVIGESYLDDTMSLISLNSGNGIQYSNAYVSDISFKGKTQYVIASSMENNRFYRISSTITDFSTPYTTALYIPSDCYVEGLELRGAQQIAVIDNGGKPVELTDIDYNDLMSFHCLYSNVAFLTSDANLKIKKALIKSKYIQKLFIDNYPSNNRYHNNVTGIIEGMDFISYTKSNDFFLTFRNNSHDSDLLFEKCSFQFNERVRGFIGVEPLEGSKSKTILSLNNIDVYYSYVDSGIIPFGVVAITDNTFVSIDGIRVFSTLKSAIASIEYPLHINNRKSKEQSTKNNVIIKGCYLDRKPFLVSKKTIKGIGQNIEWSE